MITFRHSLLAVATFLPAVSACGTEAPAADAPAQVTAAGLAEVTIRTRDNAFYEAPDTLVAGPTNIRLINDGPMFHHVWLMRLEDGHTVNELLEHLSQGGPPPSWAVDAGGPNTPGVPGGETSAVVDLAPGRYALLCAIDLPDGVPHMMKGMVREVTVIPSAAARPALPAADIVMTLDDYTFNTDVAITPGRRIIRIENAAAQAHEVLIVKLEAGRTVEEFMAFVGKPEGAPPGAIVGGVTGIAQGGMNQVTLDFEQGDYALICFIPDVGDGRPHYRHGMVKQIHVM